MADQKQKDINEQTANDIYQIIEKHLKYPAGLHLNGILNQMEIGRVKAEMVSRLNSFQVMSIAQDRTKRDEEIKDLLETMGAKIEQIENGYTLISMEGTQEKAAPTLKDAFFFWVHELVMSRPGAPKQKKHQFKLKRNYLFPAAVWFENDTDKKISAWVVDGNHPNYLYGVVRYFVDDRAAWVESPEPFSVDKKDATIKWCREIMAQLAEEIK